MRGHLVIALSCLLLSCAMGPDYQRPDVNPPDAFRLGIGGEATSLANLPWW